MNDKNEIKGEVKYKSALRVSLGVLICLFSLFGALNYGVVSEFITWLISFFVGGIFSYFVYLALFIYGLSLIFYSKRKKINFNFTILGVCLVALGAIILVTNSFYLNEDGTYLTFTNGTFFEDFKDALSISENFPSVDFTKNCGIIGILLVAIINSGMTYIGSNVIGSILIVVGVVFMFLKTIIKFVNSIYAYVKGLPKAQKLAVDKNSEAVKSTGFKDVTSSTLKEEVADDSGTVSNLSDEPIYQSATSSMTSTKYDNSTYTQSNNSVHASSTEQVYTNVNTQPQTTTNVVKNNAFVSTNQTSNANSHDNLNLNMNLYKEKPIYEENSSNGTSLKKAIYDSSIYASTKHNDTFSNTSVSGNTYSNNTYGNQEYTNSNVRNAYQSSYSTQLPNNMNSYNQASSSSYSQQSTNQSTPVTNTQTNNAYQNNNDYTNNTSNSYVDNSYSDSQYKQPYNTYEDNVNSAFSQNSNVSSNTYEAPKPVQSNTFDVKQEVKATNLDQSGESIVLDENYRYGDRAEFDKPTNTASTKKVKQSENVDIVSNVTHYEYPPSSLLEERQNPRSFETNKSTADQRAEIINKLCRDFSFDAHVENYTIGPSVTRYNIKAGENTQITKFNSLVETLSVRLGGIKARFEAIVPGQTTSGIEVQNAISTIVDFKDVFEHLPPLDTKKYNGMLIPFGKDISGNYITADMREFPHLLIAGTTGSGKSVFMHTIILTLIMRNSPEDLRLFIIDPKKVEFSKYKDIPHLLGPICTEPHLAYNALVKIVDIMEKRYRILEETETSNIKEYNRDYAPSHHVKKMPYIVVVIDEYSNLVDGCKKVSEPVLSLAQKARACGIHIIVATQAPRTSIITGVIKANLPTRVALLCANATDSMNVVDVGGAERLLGNGDMLIKSPLISTVGLTRVQGSFVDSKEIKSVVDYVKNRYGSDYLTDFTNLEDDKEVQVAPTTIQGRKEKVQDALYDEVKSYAMSMDYFSISKITRTFNIGFNRAGRIFKQLQDEGIIDANQQNNDSKGTKVLVHSSNYSTGRPLLSGEDTYFSSVSNPDEE